MTSNARSCLDVAAGRRASRSPFDRVLATDVYDGPVAGAAFCRGSSAAYVFKLLAWDEQQRRRVFSVAALRPSAAQELFELAASTGPAKWPEWWLGAAGLAEDTSKRIGAVLEEAGPAEFVILATDLLASLEYCRRVTDESVRQQVAALARRDTPLDEVSVTPFSEWLQFVEAGTTTE